MTLEFDVDISYITDDGSKDMPQWVKLNDEDGQHPSTVYVNNDSYQRSISENTKLRELVRNLLRVVPRDVSGVVIGAHGEHPTYYSFDDAIRELGVEVEECTTRQ